MRKLIIAGGLIAAAGIAAKRLASSRLSFAQMIERMPDNAPPKWMFRNITGDPREHGAHPGAARGRSEGWAMKVLVVYAHFNPDSFTRALRDELTRGLEDAGHVYTLNNCPDERIRPGLPAGGLGPVHPPDAAK